MITQITVPRIIALSAIAIAIIFIVIIAIKYLKRKDKS